MAFAEQHAVKRRYRTGRPRFDHKQCGCQQRNMEQDVTLFIHFYQC